MEQTPLKQHFEVQDEPIEHATKQLNNFVTVFCRLKPCLPHEEKSKIDIDQALHKISWNDSTKSIGKSYTFDHVFDQTVCQDRFVNSICNPLIRFIKNGGTSALIFSYGITNSGKTYSILGTKQQPGILLTLIKKLEFQFKEQVLKIVAIELYKDEFMSLKIKGKKFSPQEIKGTISFEDCDNDEINESNMQDLFSKYLQNRSCSSTTHNNLSSRSHAIFKITTKHFKIGIVDLAGSQRTSKLNHQCDIKQTVFINQSLLTLRKCIQVLEDKSSSFQKLVFPYRQSKLTQSLMEYFVNNSKINIIVNVNQARHCLEQNLQAMDYTTKAKNITANATSDFSKMLKSTAKKKAQVLSSFKSKNFVSLNKQIKRFSVQHQSQDRFGIQTQSQQVIDENEEYITSLEQQIEAQQRSSFIRQRMTEQLFEQLMQSPLSIEQFIKKQNNYREHYLSFDHEMEQQSDRKKLSALRKVNLLETEKKQISNQDENQIVDMVYSVDVATQTDCNYMDKDEMFNRQLANLQFEKLRTAMKKRLLGIVDEEKRKQLIDAETNYSQRKIKCKTIDKFGGQKIQEREDQDDSNSFTTPGKNGFKNAKSSHKSHKSAKSLNKPNKTIYSQAIDFLQTGSKKFKSGVKYVVDKVGLGNKSMLKSNKQNSKVKTPKKSNMLIWRQLQEMIQPHNKIRFVEVDTEIQTQVQEVEKMQIYENQKITQADYSTQTQEMKVQFTMHDALQNAIKQEKNNIKQKQKQKHKPKSKKAHIKTKQAKVSISTAQTQVDDEEDDTCQTQDEVMILPTQKDAIKMKPNSQSNNNGQRTAFKNFSINKKDIEVSMEKRKAFMSAVKLGVAKNTRGAQRKRANNN